MNGDFMCVSNDLQEQSCACPECRAQINPGGGTGDASANLWGTDTPAFAHTPASADTPSKCRSVRMTLARVWTDWTSHSYKVMSQWRHRGASKSWPSMRVEVQLLRIKAWRTVAQRVLFFLWRAQPTPGHERGTSSIYV